MLGLMIHSKLKEVFREFKENFLSFLLFNFLNGSEYLKKYKTPEKLTEVSSKLKSHQDFLDTLVLIQDVMGEEGQALPEGKS